MRILILGINYFPERTSVAPFTTGLSEHLAERGHHVYVVTAFPYYPEWRVWLEYRGEITRLETRSGVTIRRVRHFIPRRASSLVERLAHDFSFALAALVAGLAAGPCDVVYCSSPPPALALAAYAISRVRGVPYAIKLTDLASEAALATGIIHHGWLMACARAIERFVYRHARAVICLCSAFCDRLANDGPEPGRMNTNQLVVIPDWADTEAVRPVESDGSFRLQHGIGEEKFVILHTGNMGRKQDLIHVVRAAEKTRPDPRLLWVLVGEGEERPLLEYAGRTLPNLLLLPLQPAAALGQMYAGADLLLLHQKKKVKDAVIPSKLLTYMASGKPVLCAAHAESTAAALVRDAECGQIVEPENPDALAEAALVLRDDLTFYKRSRQSCREQLCRPLSQPLTHTWGANGRRYVVENFERAYVLGLYD